MKCKDFEINCENSDAKCYYDNAEVSKSVIEHNPNTCEHCVYNEKHADKSLEEWNEYEQSLTQPKQ